MGNRRGNSGNNVRLYFWGSKITADGDCSHEIKRCLLLGRKFMSKLDCILFIFFLFSFIFKLYITVLVLPNIKMNPPQVYMCFIKQRHYFANESPLSQGYGFSSGHILMWDLDCEENWVPKKTDAFELWFWRRLLRVPWTASRSHQSILQEISLGCFLEGLMLKLKLQYIGHLTRSVDS